jgi:hypothetical protein
MLGFKFIRSFLINDKAPFVVTLFVAALSWTAIRTSDRLASIPFIEYRTLLVKSEQGVSGIELRLRNITAASKFECFLLTLVARRHDTLKFADPKDQQHRLRGTVFSSLKVTRSKVDEWDVEAKNLAPGADISLFVPATGAGEPAVLGSACANVPTVFEASPTEGADKKAASKIAPEAVPILVERSFATRFVEYEIEILWLALSLWLILMLQLFAATERAERLRLAQRSKEVDHDATG